MAPTFPATLAKCRVLEPLQAEGVSPPAPLPPWLGSAWKTGLHSPRKHPDSCRHMPHSGFQGGPGPDAKGTVFYWRTLPVHGRGALGQCL